MSADPTAPLEAARRENQALRARVAELERQLRRLGDASALPAGLGSSLAEREALLAEAESVAHMGSWLWDVETDEVHWSAELYRILGHDPATVAASSERFFASIHPDDVERVRAASARGIASGLAEQVDFRVLQPDGVIRHVSMNGALLFDTRGVLKRAVGTVLDVTEAREAARQLERTAALLADAQRIGKMGSFARDLVTGAQTWSDEAYRVMDIDPGTPPSREAVFERLPPAERTRVQAAARQADTGEPVSLRTHLVTREGRLRHIEISVVTVRDATGRPTQLRGTVADVTALVELEAQLHRSQKMEAVGQLAGGLAHDFNNLLTVIIGNAEYLARAHASEALDDILDAAKAANEITRRLLAFSSNTAEDQAVVSLIDEVEDARSLLGRALGDHIALHTVHARAAWPVVAARGQIQQVLLNLALNARDAMPDGGTLTLTTRAVSLPAGEADALGLRPGDYMLLEVADTGTGMDEATRARCFEPFFTTKQSGRGTGLGLAMVFGSMKRCGGAVDVVSTPHEGTRFRLWFPRSAEEPVAARRRTTAPPRLCMKVLIVEDDAKVAKVTARMLELAGYDVRVAVDPVEALTSWAARPADVLVTDVQMPGMSGPKLSERLRAVTPELRTLFVTGHSTERLAAGAAVLMKPFREEELLRALAALLAEPSPA